MRPGVEIYRFGPFILDPAQRRLTKEGTSVPLTPKSFDLLVLLVANHGKLLTKDEILGRVWEGAETYESSLTAHVRMVREALGDETKECRYIETVTKKGYRFIGKVESPSSVYQSVPASESSRAVPSRRLRQLYFAGIVAAAVVMVTGVALRNRIRPPTPPEVLPFREAINLERQGNDDLALQKLNEALRLQPQFDEASLRAAWICYDDNDNDTASNYINAVLNRKSQITDSVRLQAEALRILLQGGREEAFNKLQLIAKADPARTDALYALSEIAVDLELFDQADRALHECQAADPRNPFCAFELVVVRVYQNRFSDAIAEYDRARTVTRGFPWLEWPAGYARLGLGDLDGALKHFHALEQAGNTFASNVHFRTSQEGIAAVALYQGRLQQARQRIIDALATSGSNYDKASYYISLAEMDALNGRVADAVHEANAAGGLSDSPDIALSAVRVLAMGSEYDSASALLKRYSGRSATLGKQYPATERFVAGLKAKSGHQWDEATAALTDSQQLQPNPESAYYLAEVQMLASRWTEASTTLDKLLKLKGKILMDSVASLIPLAQYDLAKCYQHMGNHVEAEELRSEARAVWEHADPELRNKLK